MEKQGNNKANWLETIRANEERANIRKVNEWLVPILTSYFVNRPLKDIKLVSVGCGFGADVDCLVDYGVDAYGIEPYERTNMWHLRKYPERLIVTDGKSLPFDNEEFDAIYCAEVIEHIGLEYFKNNETIKGWKERELVMRTGQPLSRRRGKRGLAIMQLSYITNSIKCYDF
jgi:2-polyprenyl-3-methyl-5-hydroxy-6-metoxy-1,4-benzoquinol methylase